jgi:hypothetical protein
MEKLLKPNREEFAKKLAITNFTDTEIEFLNTYNWENEIFDRDGLKGLKNCIGEQIIAPIYEDFKFLISATSQTGDYIVTKHKGKWGVLGTDGKEGVWIIEPIYEYVSFPNRYVICVKEDKWGVFDSCDNTWLIPLELDSITTNEGFLFCNGVAFFKKDGKEGILLSTGEFTAPIFDEIDYDIETPIRARIGDEWGFVTENGTLTQDEDEAYYMDIEY